MLYQYAPYPEEGGKTRNSNNFVTAAEFETVEYCNIINEIFKSVKRHAIDGNITEKVRHIYDVTKLYKVKEIKEFINNKVILKELVKKIKETHSFYLEKRNKQSMYNPLEKYNFNLCKKNLTEDVKGGF